MPPKEISLQIINAAIRPWDANGEHWDDTAKVSAGDIALMEAALGIDDPAEAYAKVEALLLEWALDAYAPPDPYGTATLSVNGQQTSVALASPTMGIKDTFNPDWPAPPAPGWQHVPVTPQMTVQIQLKDQDLVNPDDIGTVQLGYDDLMRATQSGGVYEVRTDGQGFNTILFVGIAVTIEKP